MWSDTQWNSWSAEVNRENIITWNCCRRCDPSYFKGPSGSIAPPVPLRARQCPAVGRAYTCAPEVTGEEFMKSKSWLVGYIPVSFWDTFHSLTVEQHTNPAVLQFVRRGMQEAFPEYKDLRPSPLKFISYFGAVRMRPSVPSSLLAFVDESTNQGWFDPSNAAYCYALDSLWPGLLKSSDISNLGTKGDVAECFLGFGWLSALNGCATDRLLEVCTHLDVVICYLFHFLSGSQA